MEWIAGGPGGRCPAGGAPLLAGAAAWTVNARVRSVVDGHAELAAVGDCTADDAELRAACRAWGRGDDGALTTLPGSMWVFARMGRRMLVCGDLAGARPLFHTRMPQGRVWASRMTPLAALTGARVDVGALVAEMTVGGVEMPERPGFEGVRELVPGWALISSDEGRTWRERDMRGTGERLTLAEAADSLRPALVDAVYRRVTTGVWSADVSGGLDSSTIASLAAENTDLVGCLYHDAHTSTADLDGARQVAAERPRIDLRVTIGDLSTVHYTGLDGNLPTPVTDRPAGSISMRAMDRAYLSPAVRAGCTDHLIGVGGDEILDPDRAWWVDLRNVVGARETRRRITSWAHQRKAAPGPVVAAVETFAATTRPAGLTSLALALHRGSATAPGSGLAWAWPSRAVPWLTRCGRETLAELVNEEARRPWTDTPGETAQGIALRSGGRSVTALTDLHRAHGLRAHAPFLDNLVVRAASSVPGWERRDPHVFKPLLGLAMRGRVPDVVLDRRSKGTMTPTMLRGIRRNLPTLRSLVLDGVLADSGMVNPHMIAAELQRAADGNGRAPLAALNQAIAIEVWTASVNTTASTWWEEPTP